MRPQVVLQHFICTAFKQNYDAATRDRKNRCRACAASANALEPVPQVSAGATAVEERTGQESPFKTRFGSYAADASFQLDLGYAASGDVALKRLKKDGLVTVTEDGQVKLTSAGRQIAERTMLRHHLIERMLTEMFGMAWYEVHDEAERLEHACNPLVLNSPERSHLRRKIVELASEFSSVNRRIRFGFSDRPALAEFPATAW